MLLEIEAMVMRSRIPLDYVSFRGRFVAGSRNQAPFTIADFIARCGRDIVMLSNSHHYTNPTSEGERAYLESLIREDFDRSHPDDSFEEMKRRSAFSREDKGLLRDWMALAARRATELHVSSELCQTTNVAHQQRYVVLGRTAASRPTG